MAGGKGWECLLPIFFLTHEGKYTLAVTVNGEKLDLTAKTDRIKNKII